jgi:hypothetical protein
MTRRPLLAVMLCASAAGLMAQPPAEVRFRVSRDTVIAGISCAPTGRASASVHANGTLVECPVPRDTVIAGHLLPAGTWPRFTNARVLDGAWLPHDHTLQGLICKGTGYKGWAVRFHADGALALCYLAHAQVIDGVSVSKGQRIERPERSQP